MPAKKTSPEPSPGLRSLTPESQENLLTDLYDRFENVRNYIDLRLTGNAWPLIKKYKRLIKNRLIEDIEEGTDGLDEALRGRK